MVPTKLVPITVFVLTVLVSVSVLSSDLTGVNGGVIAVELPEGVTTATFNEEDQLIIANHAIVAIPHDAEAKTHKLIVSLEDGSFQAIDFEVQSKEYEEQHITIENQDYVTPPEETIKRRQDEAAMMQQAYARRTQAIEDILPIVIPVKGQVTGVFGTKRFFNGEQRNYHTGVDYAAPTGTPIAAPAPGTVVLTHDMYFNGKTVVIDHGSGFISVMCHLDEIDVEKDAELKRGDVIGTVGSTGRSTGPHLHWTISLQGTKIDPQMFMQVVNGLGDSTDD